ncbi:bacillithiol system redox-active protein YtxJ [Paenibacillus sp. MMS18-CY102]|uniref:bacillithiol system redox-active protein YtxJ n=1 Tax=Paenibacillus sp. MMS18-CY102 TaxID=2682849 RepID=UPI0013651ABF|nr:bacillithiol system redox-active protein YtxJ [Paenibacillus sp. MMS18-CY102]MWC26760.1 bacillithiol system redox-active protein YtxJ [Paenibacillus sp. MMS18-CY102]
MTLYETLSTVEQWEDAAASSAEKPLFVFKHSTRCSVSAEAIEAWTKWVEENQGSGIRQTLVNVVEDRPVSNAIAEATGVTHASPQAILIVNGEAVWNTSHWHITQASLEEHLRAHCGK